MENLYLQDGKVTTQNNFINIKNDPEIMKVIEETNNNLNEFSLKNKNYHSNSLNDLLKKNEEKIKNIQKNYKNKNNKLKNKKKNKKNNNKLFNTIKEIKKNNILNN